MRWMAIEISRAARQRKTVHERGDDDSDALDSERRRIK
jgi:hypothetical protein